MKLLKNRSGLLAIGIVILIILSLTVSAGAKGDTAIVPGGEQYTDMQRAVVETALAYHNRGEYVQYDSAVLTVQEKAEEHTDQRESNFVSPEDATEDEVVYSVCSAYCFEVFNDAFGYKLLGHPLDCITMSLCRLPAEDPLVVFKYDPDDTSSSPKLMNQNKEAALKKAQELLQPGDIIVGFGTGGHAMIYIGDYKNDGTKYIAHCWGGKYKMDVGEDKIDHYDDGNNGAIRIQDAIYGCFTEGGKPYSLYSDNNAKSFIILRPINVVSENQLTENAKGRLKYSGINIDRRASVSRLGAVEQGGEVTVTVEIENCSGSAYSKLPVIERIPATGKLKEGSVTGGGSVSGDTVKWELDVPAGKSVTVSYTVVATGKRGETLDLSDGSVGGIRSNKIPIRISGKQLTGEQQSKLLNITTIQDKLKDTENMDFPNVAYRELFGIDPKIPGIREVSTKLFDRVTVSHAGKMLQQKETVAPENEKLKEQIIPLYFGGTQLRTGGDGHGRVLDVCHVGYLQPGDIVLCADNLAMSTSLNNKAYVYLGGDKIACLAKGKLLIGSAKDTLEKLLPYEFFIGFRPAQAFDDMNVEAKALPKLPFTDVKESDWFYAYVQELYGDGTVSGMTATTFVPSGNLNYGQALKLIVCALGNGEQAKTGAHWASGYLKFAQDKGWLDGDVNLDGNVSRLAFCRIAAKAKSLTAQPESNPFTDTSDPDVLALNKAGVINGMTATTFQPEGLLTRAQISKIICALRGA